MRPKKTMSEFLLDLRRALGTRRPEFVPCRHLVQGEVYWSAECLPLVYLDAGNYAYLREKMAHGFSPLS